MPTTISQSQLENLPLEILELLANNIDSPGTVAALGVVSKTMRRRVGQEWYDTLSSENQSEFARLVDEDFEEVWCHLCSTRHPPGEALPLRLNQRACQSPWNADKFRSSELRLNWHVILLASMAKYRRDGRDTSSVELFLTRPEYQHNPKFFDLQYTRVWELVFNDNGIFARKTESFLPLHERCTNSFFLKQCPHQRLLVRFRYIMKYQAQGFRFVIGPFWLSRASTQKLPRIVGQIGGCDLCNRDFHVAVHGSPRTNIPRVVRTTWYYLGKGHSAKDISQRIEKRLRPRSGPGASKIAELCSLPTMIDTNGSAEVTIWKQGDDGEMKACSSYL